MTVGNLRECRIRLGIDAPYHLPVVRQGLLDQLSDEAPATAGKGYNAKHPVKAVDMLLVRQRLMLFPARNVIATETAGGSS